MPDPRFPIQQVYNYPYAAQQPPAQYPGPTWDQAQQASHAVVMGAAPSGRLRDEPEFRNFQKVPAFYVVSITLGSQAGDIQGGSVALRPEAFILERITWACNERTEDYSGVSFGGSPQGRAVRVSWGDEFTRFLNQTPCMLSALFGDGNGYLDLVRGILFQGRQSLNVNLTRISDPTDDGPPELEFDICFQGVGLLPLNVAQSGSAG